MPNLFFFREQREKRERKEKLPEFTEQLFEMLSDPSDPEALDAVEQAGQQWVETGEFKFPKRKKKDEKFQLIDSGSDLETKEEPSYTFREGGVSSRIGINDPKNEFSVKKMALQGTPDVSFFGPKKKEVYRRTASGELIPTGKVGKDDVIYDAPKKTSIFGYDKRRGDVRQIGETEGDSKFIDLTPSESVINPRRGPKTPQEAAAENVLRQYYQALRDSTKKGVPVPAELQTSAESAAKFLGMNLQTETVNRPPSVWGRVKSGVKEGAEQIKTINPVGVGRAAVMGFQNAPGTEETFSIPVFDPSQPRPGLDQRQFRGEFQSIHDVKSAYKNGRLTKEAAVELIKFIQAQESY